MGLILNRMNYADRGFGVPVFAWLTPIGPPGMAVAKNNLSNPAGAYDYADDYDYPEHVT